MMHHSHRPRPPRPRANAQVLIFAYDRADACLRVLLQRRSPQMLAMPNHLAAVGGMFDEAVDRSSRDTAIREVLEETGINLEDTSNPQSCPAKDQQADDVFPGHHSATDESKTQKMVKFAQGKHVDWNAVFLRDMNVVERDPKLASQCQQLTAWEVASVSDWLERPGALPDDTKPSVVHGHAWVNTNASSLSALAQSSLRLMGGLLRRIREASPFMDCFLGTTKAGERQLGGSPAPVPSSVRADASPAASRPEHKAARHVSPGGAAVEQAWLAGGSPVRSSPTTDDEFRSLPAAHVTFNLCPEVRVFDVEDNEGLLPVGVHEETERIAAPLGYDGSLPFAMKHMSGVERCMYSRLMAQRGVGTFMELQKKLDAIHLEPPPVAQATAMSPS